ncbi:unnamed protein product, partial [Scytosiphon promiscuus]
PLAQRQESACVKHTYFCFVFPLLGVSTGKVISSVSRRLRKDSADTVAERRSLPLQVRALLRNFGWCATRRPRRLSRSTAPTRDARSPAFARFLSAAHYR